MCPMAENNRQADFYDAPEEEQSRIENVGIGFKDETGIIKRETSEEAKRILATPEGREIEELFRKIPRELLPRDKGGGSSLTEIKRRIELLTDSDNDNSLPFCVDRKTLRRLYFLLEAAEKRIDEEDKN
jgi:hypothetical protein